MTTLMMLAPVGVPLIAALAFALLGWRPATVWVGAISAVAMLAAAIGTAVEVHSAGPHSAVAGLLRVDALSAFMLIVIGTVAVVATVSAPAYLRAEVAAGRTEERVCTQHSVLAQSFLALMALAVLAANLGLLWVAIEATTIVTAFLVGQRRGRAAVEAGWKYVVICSTGIALALLGTFLLNFAAQQASTPAGLDWVDLVAAAPELDPGVTRIAVLLLIIGFGTKAGLAPLHGWLPDAYSQAPATVTALMSGVLSAVALYAVLRVKVIADAALGVDFTRWLLLVMSLASLILAASIILSQRDYKRMLAYSSIENMGLLALGAAIGSPLAIAAVLLHILGHGLAKSVLFLTAGRIMQVTGSSRIDRVRGLASTEPVLAGVFGCGVLAIIAFPPFSLFASELGMATAGFGAAGFGTAGFGIAGFGTAGFGTAGFGTADFAGGLGWATAAALILVLVFAAAMVGHTSRMLLGEGEPDPITGDQDTASQAAAAPDAGATVAKDGTGISAAEPGLSLSTVAFVPAPRDPAGPGPARRSRPGADSYVWIGALIVCAVLGITLGPLAPLLSQATAIVTGAAP
ncbi:MAG: proton-conducting transporter membrane subunit [Nakamurella sp.]